MTPLVAGIALTGKAPMYENVYMSGLKQKAAGEAAAAKERNKQLEDIRAAIKLPEGGVHNSLVGEVKDVAAETLFNVTKVIEADPVRGINKAWDMVLDFKSKMNVYSNTSKQLAKIETPEYNKNYFSSPQFIQGIGTKNLKDVESDPAIVENAKKAGVNIQRVNGLPVVSTIDYPRFDPAKPFVDWQKATVAQYEAEVGDPTKLGKSLRQEILKRVNEQEAMAYLEGSAADDNEVAAWQNKHNINITTPEGRKAAAQRFLYTQEKAQTSGPGFNISVGGGSLSSKEATISPLDSSADASYGWSVFSIPGKQGRFQVKTKEGLIAKREDGENMEFASSQDAINWIDKNSKKTLSGEALQVGYEASSLVPKDGFYIGEKTSRTKFGERVQGNTVNAKVTRIEAIPIYTGTETKQYGLFVLKPGDPVLKEVLDIDPNIKNEKRLFVVAEGGKVVGSGGKETTIGATMYLPATKANLGAVLKGIPPADRALRGQIEKIIKGEKFGGAGVISAATKGAETQPKSGFSLLQFDTFA
jgi:hypothetical protein